MLSLALLWMGVSMPGSTAQTSPAGKVEWARLKTPNVYWARHSNCDPNLLRFIQNSTTLNIDPKWRAADVETLSQMCAYPFLFSDGIHSVTDPTALNNIREYLKRGGFLFIDSCINTDINPDPDQFLKDQIEKLKSLLPDIRVEQLPADHEIYHNCFQMAALPHTYMRNIYNPAWARHGLYAVYSGQRLCSLISLSGLQCGWAGMDPDPNHVTECMKMMVNIYVYCVTH
jgi:hypothetical protein